MSEEESGSGDPQEEGANEDEPQGEETTWHVADHDEEESPASSEGRSWQMAEGESPTESSTGRNSRVIIAATALVLLLVTATVVALVMTGSSGYQEKYFVSENEAPQGWTIPPVEEIPETMPWGMDSNPDKIPDEHLSKMASESSENWSHTPDEIWIQIVEGPRGLENQDALFILPIRMSSVEDRDSFLRSECPTSGPEHLFKAGKDERVAVIVGSENPLRVNEWVRLTPEVQRVCT